MLHTYKRVPTIEMAIDENNPIEQEIDQPGQLVGRDCYDISKRTRLVSAALMTLGLIVQLGGIILTKDTCNTTNSCGCRLQSFVVAAGASLGIAGNTPYLRPLYYLVVNACKAVRGVK
jgi:hypothetical protein